MTDLPHGWAVTALGEVMDVQGGSQPPKSQFKYEPNEGYVRLLQIRDFGAKPVPTYVPKKTVSKFCEKNDVLIARYGASLGRILTGMQGAYNVALAKTIFSNDLFLHRYIFWLLKTDVLQTPLRMISRSAQNGFARHEIAHIELPVPPLNEQRRIVEKIEAMFDEIDKGVESLQKARATLGLYRQSLLKSAFEGRLTADWRAQNADKLESPETLLSRIQKEREDRYKAALDAWQEALAKWREGGEKGKKPAKPKRPKTFPDELKDLQITPPELPFGWRWAHLGWCSSGPEYGTSAKSSDTGEVPVIRMGNLQRGGIDWKNLAYTSDPEEIEQYSLKSGDVLFNRTNSPELVGKTSIYKGERPALFAGYLVRVNQIDEIASGPYLTYFLNSPYAREHGKTVKTDGVNQSNINASKLQEYPFPYCSPAEQAEIVRILDAQLEAADALEAEIDAALTRADALRQSILKKAFSGRLVPQDPKDEPASILLERIKAERAKAATTKRQRKANA
ncbi:restriction endonuclease subunit S [Celeribacter halophilus]|uniref:restriction endonuclease subunit S n=1 Tax=Celeribacter halophilus TaxID=576117 RepID=UPI003A917EC8